MSTSEKAFVTLAVLVLIGSAIVGYSSTSQGQLTVDPPQTVDHVDPQKYVGRWYEQCSIPSNFEINCIDTQAFYTIIDEKTLGVENSCTRDGNRTVTAGKAFIEDSSNSKLRVVFNPVTKTGGQYWIVKLGDAQNYGYSIVSSPDYRYLWILAREQRMDETTYNELISWLKNQGGFETDKLVRTKH